MVWYWVVGQQSLLSALLQLHIYNMQQHFNSQNIYKLYLRMESLSQLDNIWNT